MGARDSARQAAVDGRSEPGGHFAAVGAMLVAHGLDPTPRHYRLCHRYLDGEDPAFRALADCLIKRCGGLTSAVMATLDAHADADVSPDELLHISREAQVQLDRLTGLVGRSGDDARAYGAALETGVAGVARSEGPGALDGLLCVTRTMIARTRAMEDHLRRAGGEISALQHKLAEARQSANSDPLTGLANRRALDARMRDAWEGVASGRPFAVAIADIDHFKRVNDAFGHPVGDEVIKLVGTALTRGSGREGGPCAFVSRYGGEEFVLLFEGLGPAEAAAELDAVRIGIAGRDIKVTTSGRRLGSIGFSAGVAGAEGRTGPSDMLKAADAALYRAKAAGRGRVLLADDGDEAATEACEDSVNGSSSLRA